MRLYITINTDRNTLAVWGDDEIIDYYAEYSNVDFNATTFQEIIENAKEEE